MTAHSLRFRRLALAGPVLAVSAALLAAGCGSGGVPVAGEVIEDGRPVETGFVQFSPDAEKGTIGPAMIMDISQGKFSNASESVPTVTGNHRVRIVVPVLGPNREAMPREYLVEASVPPSGVTDLKFEVSSKPAAKAQR